MKNETFFNHITTASDDERWMFLLALIRSIKKEGFFFGCKDRLSWLNTARLLIGYRLLTAYISVKQSVKEAHNSLIYNASIAIHARKEDKIRKDLNNRSMKMMIFRGEGDFRSSHTAVGKRMLSCRHIRIMPSICPGLYDCIPRAFGWFARGIHRLHPGLLLVLPWDGSDVAFHIQGVYSNCKKCIFIGLSVRKEHKSFITSF